MDAATDGVGRGTADFTGCCSRVTGSFFGVGLASRAIGVMMYPDCGWFEWRPAPEFNAELNYVHTGRNRPIRVYHAIDQRFILEDFFAKLARWYRKAP